MKYGLIAGNGRFPILALEEARKLGHEVVAIGIQEEAPKEIEALATRTYWISLGALSRLIEILKSEGMDRGMIHCFTGDLPAARRYLDDTRYVQVILRPEKP